MNVKFKVMLIAYFFLCGLVTVVYASGTSSSSSSWGKVSNDQQNTDSSQGTDSDNQQNTNASQGTSMKIERILTVALEKNLDGTQKKSAVSLYDQGMEANKNGDYQKARTLFEQALSVNSNNPDILNMLAHTQLKVGLIDDSLENYKKALQLRPRFPEAREYLGETYIQAALRELATLKSYGKDGAEQEEDLEKEIKKAAGAL
jgi:tetratricopeptide (TPR) repeat protein